MNPKVVNIDDNFDRHGSIKNLMQCGFGTYPSEIPVARFEPLTNGLVGYQHDHCYASKPSLKLVLKKQITECGNI